VVVGGDVGRVGLVVGLAGGRGEAGVVRVGPGAGAFAAPHEEGDYGGDEDYSANCGADADAGFGAGGEARGGASGGAGAAGADDCCGGAGGVACGGGGRRHEVVLPEDAAAGEGRETGVGGQGGNAGVEHVGGLAVGCAASHGEFDEVG